MAQDQSKVKLNEALETLHYALNESAKSDPNVRSLFNIDELSRARKVVASEVAAS